MSMIKPYYLVVTIHSATPVNTNFYGDYDGTHTHIHGKKFYTLNHWYGQTLVPGKLMESLMGICRYDLETYGYTTKAAGMRALKSYKAYDDRESDRGYWTVQSNLYRVDLEDNKVVGYEVIA